MGRGTVWSRSGQRGRGAAARAAGHAVVVYQSEFRPLKHTLSGNPERTLMKLVVDERIDRLLGVHPTSAEEFVTMRQPRS